MKGGRAGAGQVGQTLIKLHKPFGVAGVRDTIVSRFNPPAEPARTVGFGKRDSARRNCKQPCEEGIGSRQVFSVGKIRVS
jgi:hypothetical protein